MEKERGIEQPPLRKEQECGGTRRNQPSPPPRRNQPVAPREEHQRGTKIEWDGEAHWFGTNRKESKATKVDGKGFVTGHQSGQSSLVCALLLDPYLPNPLSLQLDISCLCL
ncbi:hypothetical protein RIF29_29029 [Crotalaria pallida]|uniref:Uncharacterized protein n=1 Tax=Crotalaria pallida TaxID=3830 RepID=A0AAN9EIZ8_CROPI